jgi:hypothetical protein
MSDVFDEDRDFEYCNKVCRASQSKDVPGWVRNAAQRILEISKRKNIPIDEVRFKDVGLGLHDNIVESAIIGDEGQRFYKIVMNFEEAIKNMKGLP